MTIANQPDQKNQPARNVAELVQEIELLTAEIQELYCSDAIPWCVGYSGGKDSTATLQLVWNAIASLPIEKRTKAIHVITNDTLVENPLVSSWVGNSLEQMKVAAKDQQMPVEPHLLHPATKDTFWVNLIGKGYPAPRNRFRWCTERLKIQPADSFIRAVIRSSGEVILVLGTRKAESVKRAANMARHREWRVRDRINTNPNRPNSLIYLPIEDWRTDEVWLYLMQWQNPWGYSNKDLFTMYRGATADNECPLVVDTSTPSCGDSRFGCWVCTMVSKDKSMEAMIQNDEEKEWMQPLLDIRNDLDVQDDRDKRDFRRIWGEVQLFERNHNGELSVEPIPGPYTKYWREHWLRRVLEAQTQVRCTAPENMRDITLITTEELSEIRRIWLEEKHEFDDSLPRIYAEVTGESFIDIRPGADYSLLGSDEWNVLEEICDGDAMHLELMAKLLDTERQFRKMARRVGIYDALEKCFKSSSRSQDEAIKNAHFKRDLKDAVGKGDVDKVKQLTLGDAVDVEDDKPMSWGNFKFKK
ncbi:DNA phosphorothioation system sulfurtransferase DndC [Chroococcidiopsis sp. CCNUC1]|jgi:DNA sulfur modification protein DndC|uniref:DNA phosphorothioation system sulfurtransferase DndC n=1 Tax=Chroococcidiopsis sp. CCNUC1 TaxID=2653189 RepID=UPI000D08335D|nr:DNA phosphorothioation system sulfurtransferase DndC [Chroococcidiopsis sp. CCNUC1]PSB49697.1 DNA phosphorothioation system sulfurtransferase DndC [Cyanosarcina cf. burmensis CCALA 770]URD53070.1 DNA phosphorothioation system sulfurtransferase DndC [Chroococcidiopsis sp. CCNUC1]